LFIMTSAVAYSLGRRLHAVSSFTIMVELLLN